MDWNLTRRAFERRIAKEVVSELFHALTPAMDAGADAQTLIDENRGLIGHLLGVACERHGLKTEAEVVRVFGYLVPALSDLNRRFGELNRKIESATTYYDRKQQCQ